MGEDELCHKTTQKLKTKIERIMEMYQYVELGFCIQNPFKNL
jgi:hypothetical protein